MKKKNKERSWLRDTSNSESRKKVRRLANKKDRMLERYCDQCGEPLDEHFMCIYCDYDRVEF